MRTSEVRTQIYLPRRLHRDLRRAAKQRGVSMAQLLREAAEDALRRCAPEAPDPLADLIGIVKGGPADMSTEHDHYLYGMPRSKP